MVNSLMRSRVSTSFQRSSGRNAVVIFVVALALLLSACTVPMESAAKVPADSASEGAGESGGWVRIGAPSEAFDTFNPFFAQGLADWLGLWGVYDTLAWLVGSEVQMGLAESVTPNEDGSEWTITLREATFHDGSPVRPQDVVYSFATFADPEQAPFFAQFFFNIDIANIRILDEKTLVVPLHSPQGDFLDRNLATISIVVPEGTAGGAEAIGSGPFKLEAYEPGKSS